MLWGNTDVKSGTGTIAIANVDANAIYGTLTGTSTLLGTEVKVGNYIIADGRKYLLVAITSNTAGVVAGDLTGVLLANVDAGNTFTVQEGPAFIGSEDKGDLDEIFGVDVTEAVVSGNASVQQYIVTFKGSGYFSAPTVTVDGNANFKFGQIITADVIEGLANYKNVCFRVIEVKHSIKDNDWETKVSTVMDII